jgi:hypothetical protein
MTALNFDELVVPMADEAPHAVVLDWYRRLELAIGDYLASRHFSHRTGRAAENVLAADVLLGEEVATAIAALREIRNRVAHGPHPISASEAVTFAREALSLIGRLWLASDAHAA